jgi:hypothetical protein
MKSRGLSHVFWDSEVSCLIWCSTKILYKSAAVLCAAVLERLDWQFPWLPDSGATIGEQVDRPGGVLEYLKHIFLEKTCCFFVPVTVSADGPCMVNFLIIGLSSLQLD